ncbi:phosphoglycerate mutase family protein [Petrimonas sp.]|jgi:predicted nucleotidyltransferase|uniref:phosphoglycerate mutase family protein n=1 Tax=Petrimonas sp. TaxID=2023866 RepID=UPI002A2ADD58|nr:phosphoglycerate mutase family protein [Petrimonas sp.]MEA5072423.1 phosphoglycerate mutase family protein [Petrimonas sp.]
MDILTLAAENQQTAWQILKETGIVQTWEKAGATVNLVGSLKSGLLMKNRDIDMHIYTDKLSVSESFSVIQELAERLSLKEIHYKNLIDTEEECIEWHVLYEHNNRDTWKFDMIHIRKGSRYDGTVERVTDAITERLTPEIRKTILQLKQEIPEGIVIPGIEIYHAVFEGDVSSYEELEQWRKNHPLINSLDWLPQDLQNPVPRTK